MEWDTRQWREDLESKRSLEIYRKFKTKIQGEEKIYDNTPASVIYYRARINNLQLNNRNRHTGGEVKCELCSAEIEDLQHFLQWCPAYGEVRKTEIRLQQPYEEEENSVIGRLLFAEENWERAKETIYRMWKIREKKLKEIN